MVFFYIPHVAWSTNDGIAAIAAAGATSSRSSAAATAPLQTYCVIGWGHVGDGGCVVRMILVFRLTVYHTSSVCYWWFSFEFAVVWIIGAGVVAGGLSVCMSFGLFARLFVCLSVNLLVCLFICPLVGQSIGLWVCLPRFLQFV